MPHWSKILIRGTNWLGDAVMSLPAIRAVRRRFPQAHIAVLARPWVADLYRTENSINEVITTGKRSWHTARALRSKRFDCAILLPNSFDSALAAWMARIPTRIGYDRDGRGMLLTQRIQRPAKSETPPHEIFYYLELLRRAGIIDTLPAEACVELTGAAEARCRGERLFAQIGMRLPVIGVSPGAQNSRAKQWMPERFAAAACRVAAETGSSVAVFGSAREHFLCKTVAEMVRREGIQVISVAGETSLSEFIDLAAACRAFLTNDSGAMHVASALGVPTVAVFGPTEYLSTAPAGPRSVIVREPVECSPCMLRDCPIDHRCMTRISAARVAETALELLK